ncbi:MAG: hypothetical protein ACIARQ_14755 [Phycisphaerales bacterium JB061]
MSVSAVTANQPNRSLYAGLMLGAALAAGGCAYAVAHFTGGPDTPTLMIAVLVAVVSLLGLLPILVRSAEYFGMAVLGASMARLLLAMFAAMILTEVSGVQSRPVWLATVAGMGLTLIVESASATMILLSIERKKAGATSLESSTTC